MPIKEQSDVRGKKDQVNFVRLNVVPNIFKTLYAHLRHILYIWGFNCIIIDYLYEKIFLFLGDEKNIKMVYSTLI